MDHLDGGAVYYMDEWKLMFPCATAKLSELAKQKIAWEN